MKYQVTDGVVMKNICGEYLLISTGDARRSCPPYRSLNRSGAYFFALLSQSGDTEIVLKTAKEKFKIDETMLKSDIAKFISELEKNGFIISVNSDD